MKLTQECSKIGLQLLALLERLQGRFRAPAQREVLTYDDVEIPAGRLADRLRAEQNETFVSAAA